jgi:hypothetical protein
MYPVKVSAFLAAKKARNKLFLRKHISRIPRSGGNPLIATSCKKN